MRPQWLPVPIEASRIRQRRSSQKQARDNRKRSADMKSPYFRSEVTNDYSVYYLRGGFPLWNDLHRWSLLIISHSVVFLHIGKTCPPTLLPTPPTSYFIRINTPDWFQESAWQTMKIQHELEAAVSPSVNQRLQRQQCGSFKARAARRKPLSVTWYDSTAL